MSYSCDGDTHTDRQTDTQTHIHYIHRVAFDVITSIVSFLWAYTTAARDVTGERVRTAYDVTAACYRKRRTQRLLSYMVLTLSRQFVTLTGTGKAVRVFFSHSSEPSSCLRDVPADAGFLFDKPAVLVAAIKE